jgi:hypothetical protein
MAVMKSRNENNDKDRQINNFAQIRKPRDTLIHWAQSYTLNDEFLLHIVVHSTVHEDILNVFKDLARKTTATIVEMIHE